MYSAHDNTIAVLWEYLHAKNFDWYYIPFASYVQIKVYLDDENQLKAFAYANGIKLEFGLENDSLEEMLKYLEEISYKGKGYDRKKVNHACQ
jgi:hypothetical protein